MKIKLIILFLVLQTKWVNAQFNQQWINNFCCFDSISPHTFSYPLGKEINQDTLTISFFEDYFLNFKKINLVTGNDIQNFTLLSDTIQSPFYFGGGTTKISNQFITSSLKFDNNTGQFRLFLFSISNDLTPVWSNEIPTAFGKISSPLGTPSGTDFYICGVSDSIRVFKQTIGGVPLWEVTVPLENTNPNTRPYIYLNSMNELIVYVLPNDSTLNNSSVRLIKLNSTNGSMLKDSIYANSLGTSHISSLDGDTLKIAFIKTPGQVISFLDINLVSLNETKYFASNISSFSNLTKFSIDTTTHNYFFKNNDTFWGYSLQDTLVFSVNLVSEKKSEYDVGDLAFEQQNIVMSYSFHNSLNNPPNNDIKILKIDKTSGAIIGSAEYNDSRNTDENFIDNFMLGNSYYIVFANNFDNGSILQEETQLGIIKYANQPLSAYTTPNSEIKTTIFPNPFTSQATIAFSEEQTKTTIKIRNIIGEEIRTINFTGRRFIIDKAEMKAGIYFVQITDEKQNVTNKKIIIL